MTYPPADDRLRHLLAQEINTRVSTWKLAFLIADDLVKSPEIRAELDRIATAHTAGQPCGDRNCHSCFTAATNAAPPTPTSDRAAALGLTPTEYRARSHRAAMEAIQAALPSLYASVGLRLKAALATEEQPESATPGERPRCPHCQLPHDLTPGSLPVVTCEATRQRIARAEQSHIEGDHSLCNRRDCPVLRQS